MDKQKIAKELMMVAKELTAASEIDFDELPADRQALVKKMHLKPVQVWGGINGYIIEAKAGRITADYVKKLVSDSNFRWIEAQGRERIAIGF